MLRILRADEALPAASLELDAAVAEGARAICERVRAEGDAALVELTRTHDGAELGSVVVPPEEVAAAAVPSELEAALVAMADRLRDLHARQLPAPWEAEERGLRFGETIRPVAAAGCYVPGGRASYPSSVLMTVLPAKVAGVPRVVLCSPPAADGSLPPAVLVAARIAGADQVVRVGGAQAIAAMAYGTQTVAPVDVIVGPGNVWVTAAKREVAGVVGIDGLAGPTELVIVADATADPAVLAVDLVAQAEHDPLARATLISLDEALVAKVDAALEAEVVASPRREIVESAMGSAFAMVAPDADAAARAVDAIAPEHLQVVVGDPRGFLEKVRSFGAAFLGPDTPVAFGDYGAGSNHVLPTMRTARFASGLRAADFVTVSSFVEASPEALAALGPEVELVAHAEGLPGHARASEVRR